MISRRAGCAEVGDSLGVESVACFLKRGVDVMKANFAIATAAAAAFVFMGYQTGMFGSSRTRGDSAESKSAEDAQKPTTRARFPEDLAPAARAKAVEPAAPFEVADRPHKLVFLKVNGTPHPWQKDIIDYHEDWTGTNVEETELVVVVSGQARTIVDTIHFANGPPVERERWELEASVVAAKTGKVLAHRRFVNLPRAIRQHEAYELTSLGAPVKMLTVFDWVAAQSRRGFSAAVNANPLVTVVERQ